jgi:hypothetical protein
VAGYLTKIVAYQVQQDGNWDPVSFKKTDLKAKQVFILVNDERKEIWIWIGEGADVRTRFITSTAAAEIRRIYGFTLRVRTADHGSEPRDFWKCLDLIPKEGLGPDISVPISEKVLTRPIESSSFKKLSKQAKSAPKRKTKRKTTKKSEKILSSSVAELKEGESLITTPPCPQCEKGNLLPYSKAIQVTTRRKEVLVYATWICSKCNFSPETSEQ